MKILLRAEGLVKTYGAGQSAVKADLLVPQEEKHRLLAGPWALLDAGDTRDAAPAQTTESSAPPTLPTA